MVVLYTSVSDIYILHGDPKKWSGKILLNAHGMLNADMDDIIRKPYRTNDLFEKMNQ